MRRARRAVCKMRSCGGNRCRELCSAAAAAGPLQRGATDGTASACSASGLAWTAAHAYRSSRYCLIVPMSCC
jgi:hypothetical protein